MFILWIPLVVWASLDDFQYIAFRYHFNLRHQGRDVIGRGETFIDTTRNLFRLTGYSNPNFGKTKITIIVNGKEKLVTTHLDLEDQNESQCIEFPFPETPDAKKRMDKLPTGSDENIPWVRGRELHLTWEGHNITHVSVVKGPKRLREYTVDSFQTEWAPDEVLDPPFLPVFDQAEEWQCVPVDRVEERLVHIGLRWPHDRLSLQDVIAAASLNNPHLFIRAALALPGDLAVSIQAPDPPNFKDYDAISFHYEMSNLGATPLHVSSGKLWLDIQQQMLKIMGHTNVENKGEVELAVTVFGNEEKLASDVTIGLQGDSPIKECIWYDYPVQPTGLLNELADLEEESLIFQGVVDEDQRESQLFLAPTSRNRMIHLFIDNDEGVIWRVKVVSESGKQIQTDITNWVTHQERLDQQIFFVSPKCEINEGDQSDDDITRLRLKSPHGKSLALMDEMFALSTFTKSTKQAVLLSALALPGEIKIMLDEPRPPNLSLLNELSYTYEGITHVHGYPFSGHNIEMSSRGEFTLNAETRQLKVQGLMDRMPKYGRVNATVIINTATNQVVSHMTWTKPSPGNQCMITKIPPTPEYFDNDLAEQQKEPLQFVRSENVGDVECDLFQIRLKKKGRTMVLAVDRDEPDKLVRLSISEDRHPWEFRSVMDFKHWSTDAPDPSVFEVPSQWMCRKKEDIAEPVLNGPGLEEPNRKSMSLGDSIFAMTKPMGDSRIFSLPLLSLPGDLDLVFRAPESVNPTELQYLYSEFSGFTDNGRFRGFFAMDLSRNKLLVNATSTELSPLGQMELALLIDANTLYVTAVYGAPEKAYCFAYSLSQYSKVESPSSWAEVHFLGTKMARDGTEGKDSQCHVFEVNIPGSKTSRLRIYKTVADNDVILMEMGRANETSSVSILPSVWATRRRRDPSMFDAPTFCQAKSSQDLFDVLSDKMESSTFPPILEAVARARFARRPPLYLLGFPIEWPHFANHLQRLCRTTPAVCARAEVALPVKPHPRPSGHASPLSRESANDDEGLPSNAQFPPLGPGPVGANFIAPLGIFSRDFSFSFDSHYLPAGASDVDSGSTTPLLRRGQGQISVSVANKSLRLKAYSVGSLSPGIEKATSIVIMEAGLLRVQIILDSGQGRDQCIEYKLDGDDFGPHGGLTMAKIATFGVGYNYIKQVGHRKLQMQVEGEGSEAKLTSLFLLDEIPPESRINVDVIDFAQRTSALDEELKLHNCTRVGELPGTWDVLRIFF